MLPRVQPGLNFSTGNRKCESCLAARVQQAEGRYKHDDAGSKARHVLQRCCTFFDAGLKCTYTVTVETVEAGTASVARTAGKIARF